MLVEVIAYKKHGSTDRTDALAGGYKDFKRRNDGQLVVCVVLCAELRHKQEVYQLRTREEAMI